MLCFPANGNDRGISDLADDELPDIPINNFDFHVDMWDGMSNTSTKLLTNTKQATVTGTDSEGEGEGSDNSDTISSMSLPRFDIGQSQDLSLFSDESDANDETVDEGVAEAPTEHVQAPENEENAPKIVPKIASEEVDSIGSKKNDSGPANIKDQGRQKKVPVAVVAGKRRARRTRGKKPSRFDSQFLMV